MDARPFSIFGSPQLVNPCPGGQPDSASTDSGPPPADGGVAGSAGPEALIGSWTLTDVDDDESSPECERASVQTPGWLRRVTAYRLDAPVAVLLDDRGRPVARLFPGATPTAGPNMADSEAAPPVVTDEFRRSAVPAVELPAALTPADRHRLVGRWAPVSGKKQEYVEFAEDGAWRTWDGCTDVIGRWLAAPGGTFLPRVVSSGQLPATACRSGPGSRWPGGPGSMATCWCSSTRRAPKPAGCAALANPPAGHALPRRSGSLAGRAALR